jgi:hypothetical protein
MIVVYHPNNLRLKASRGYSRNWNCRRVRVGCEQICCVAHPHPAEQ